MRHVGSARWSSTTAVLLDVDGTLVDTNYQHAIAWYLAFRQHDIAVPIWRIHRHLGMGGDQLVARIAGEQVEREMGEQLRAAHGVLYLSTIQSVSALEGSRELLADLAAAGRTVVLASSAPQRELDHYLDLLDARELVDDWTTADSVAATKPAPDLVLAALAQAQTDDAVLIGDSPWDIEAASRAGIGTVVVLTGGFSEAELRDAGALAVFQSINDLRAELADSQLSKAGR